MIISLVAGAAHVANAATLILLAPGAALAEYLSSSALYSMAVWINLWVLPSAWGYRTGSIVMVRQGQLVLAVLTALTLIVVHPTAVGLAFVLLLFIDTSIFYSAPLLFDSDTRRTQLIDLSRACLATLSLVLTFLFFERSPTAYSWCLVVVASGMGIVLLWTGWHRPPRIVLNVENWPEVARDFKHAFREQRLRALLGARIVEVTSFLALAHFVMLGPLIALKIAIAVAQALCNNARRYSQLFLILIAISIYAAAIAAILLLNVHFPRYAPATLQLITIEGAVFALPIMTIYFWLVLFGIRTNAEDSGQPKKNPE